MLVRRVAERSGRRGSIPALARTNNEQCAVLNDFFRNRSNPASIVDYRTLRFAQRPEFAEHGILDTISN